MAEQVLDVEFAGVLLDGPGREGMAKAVGVAAGHVGGASAAAEQLLEAVGLVVAKLVRLGPTAARDLGIIHEEAERRLGFRMSDTQAAAFGLAELCRLWDQATIGTGAVFDRNMSRRAGSGEPGPDPGESRAEHPFGSLEVAAPRQHDDEQPADA